MFSSGFFLLPGLAAAKTGPSVTLAYLLAGVLIVPAMLSVAELATAMPRAGGAYYFVDRSLGPAAGTVGGMGTWVALVLKSAFALIGMGAYLGLYFEVPIRPLAVGLTALFVALNIVGAKETSGFQKLLVLVLLVILGVFLAEGMAAVSSTGFSRVTTDRFVPFAPFGVMGLVATTGFVFVSYAGVTKVASVSEEVHRPDRNILLGMTLSLAVSTFVYVVGVAIIVALLEPEALRNDLTPVATAAARLFAWLPDSLGVILIVVAAIAAFVSTANAGVLAASRYLLAMSRDRLLWGGFAGLGRFQTPTLAVLATGGAIALVVVSFDVEGVAKLASAFQLFLFALLTLAVIVMRESRIDSYDPGFRAPLYPWLHLIGFGSYVTLIVLLGWLPSLFSLGLVALALLWFRFFARPNVVRTGAIYHVFERLGRQRFAGLEYELRDIIKEKGLRAKDPFDEVVARAHVIDEPGRAVLTQLVGQASAHLHQHIPQTGEELAKMFLAGLDTGLTPVAHGAALLHTRVPDMDASELVLGRVAGGVTWDAAHPPADQASVRALFFLVSGENNPGLHLRLLGALANRIEEDGFLADWLEAPDAHGLKTMLLRDDRVLSFRIADGTDSAALAGRALRELNMPAGSLVALIRRHGDHVVPRGRTVLREGDELTIIGDPQNLRVLARLYGVEQPSV